MNLPLPPGKCVFCGTHVRRVYAYIRSDIYGIMLVAFCTLPGTPDTEMKKLLRLAKEKRKEEKVLQKLLKMKGAMLASPAVSTSY